MNRSENGTGDTDADRGTPAHQIDVTLFREIILLPFTIDWVQLGNAPGRERMQAAQVILDQDGIWTLQNDRLLHLPGDRNQQTDETREVRARRLRAAYEEFVYFEPYVQKFLYGSPRSEDIEAHPVALYVRNDITHLHVAYPDREFVPDDARLNDRERILRRYCFKVERCNLYLFETGNALLALELLFEGVEPVQRLQPLPDDVRRNATRMTLADCQTIMESLRRVFPPYFTEEQGRFADPEAKLEAFYFARSFAWQRSGQDPKHLKELPIDPIARIEEVFGGIDPERRAPPMFDPWREVLEPLVVDGGKLKTEHSVVLGQTGDDRAFLMAEIGVPDVFQISRSDWVRLALCDAPGRSYPYARQFLANFEQDHCYDRFFDRLKSDPDKTTRYLICGFAFVMVGTCEKTETDWFCHLFSRHFSRQYFQLVLISLFQKVALLTLSERLAEALNSDDFDTKASSIHNEVLRFTHRYWFEDITAQLQGQELFGYLRRHLRTTQMYGQLSREVRETSDRIEAQRQLQLAEGAHRLNKIAGFGLALTCIFGFLGMNVFGTGEPFGQVGIGWFVLSSTVFGSLFSWLYDKARFLKVIEWLWNRLRNCLPQNLGEMPSRICDACTRLLSRRPRP